MAKENHGDRRGQDGRAQETAGPNRKLNHSPHAANAAETLPGRKGRPVFSSRVGGSWIYNLPGAPHLPRRNDG
jgi:hypothetical protein